MAADFICLNCFSISRLGKKSGEVPKRYLLFSAENLVFQGTCAYSGIRYRAGGSDTGQVGNGIYEERGRDLWNLGRD